MTIINLLDEIDPKQILDRNKVIADITQVAYSTAVNNLFKNLDEQQQKDIKNILEGSDNKVEALYNHLKEIGKQQELLDELNRVIPQIQQDYIQTQIKALSQAQKIALLQKYPELQQR